MKKIFLILITSFLVLPQGSFAQTKTPTKTAIPSNDEIKKINEKVDQLKDKVASRVAQLKLVEKRGTLGIVESVSDTQITINDLNDKIRIIEVDEFTKFSSGSNNSYGISDIKKGAKISALGLYNKESEKLLARFVNEVSIPLFLEGVISRKDENGFTITLSTEDGTNYKVDIERITKTFAYSDGELQTSGFKKIKTLENALVLGFPDPKEKDRLTASRIITFPDLPKNPKVQIIEEVSSPTGQSPRDGAKNSNKQ